MPGRKPKSQNAVILTTTSIVYQEIRVHLTDVHEKPHPQGTIYEQGTFILSGGQQWIVAITEVGSGNVAAAIEAERAIDYLKPDIAMFVGVAGGIKDVKVGDVVAATKVYGYESGKVGDEGFLVRPDVGESSHRLIQRAKAEGRRKGWLRRIRGRSQDSGHAPQVQVGPIAAGEKVIASTSSDLSRFLHLHYNDALAVEMEGRGFLQSTHATQQVEALIIQGIGSLIDEDNKVDSEAAEEIAARHASAFTFEILAKLNPVTLDQKSQIKRVSSRIKPLRTIRPDKNQIHRVNGDGGLAEASPVPGTIEASDSHEQAIRENNTPETPAAEVIDTMDQHILGDTLQEQYSKVKKLYDFFVSRKDIYPDQCDRSIHILDEVLMSVQALCHSDPLTDYVIQMSLENISELINDLKYSIQGLRHIGPPHALNVQRQQYEKELNRIRSGLDKLVKSLEQLNKDRQILTDFLE